MFGTKSNFSSRRLEIGSTFLFYFPEFVTSEKSLFQLEKNRFLRRDRLIEAMPVRGMETLSKKNQDADPQTDPL